LRGCAFRERAEERWGVSDGQEVDWVSLMRGVAACATTMLEGWIMGSFASPIKALYTLREQHTQTGEVWEVAFLDMSGVEVTINC
jgi:hypothetical protein